MKKNTRIEVEWDDTLEDPSWMTEEEAGKIPSELHVKTAGYFLKEDDKYLWLSSMISAKRRRGNRSSTIIPKGTITKIRILKPERRKK